MPTASPPSPRLVILPKKERRLVWHGLFLTMSVSKGSSNKFLTRWVDNFMIQKVEGGPLRSAALDLIPKSNLEECVKSSWLSRRWGRRSQGRAG